MKPLERSQLKNWRSYLDFEVKEGDHERTIVLYERCLIACALYEDMWIRVGWLQFCAVTSSLQYARYLESRSDTDAARMVYKRACQIHLPKKPNPHLAWSAFEEKLRELAVLVKSLLWTRV